LFKWWITLVNLSSPQAMLGWFLVTASNVTLPPIDEL
jgi:hypothetical protein